jgi:hypothetical protein
MCLAVKLDNLLISELRDHLCLHQQAHHGVDQDGSVRGMQAILEEILRSGESRETRVNS